MGSRFQPERLDWPWTSDQMESLDRMLQELYEDVSTASPSGVVEIGDLLYGSARNVLSRLAIGTVGKVLRSDGTLPIWSTSTIPDTFASGDLVYASAANVLAGLTIGASGTVLRSTGSLPAYSTFTIPDTFAQGDVIYGSATNVLTALVKNTTASRYLSNQGTSNNPDWQAVNLANGVSGALAATNGGTGQTAVATGDLLYGSATNVWSRLSAGAAGRYLRGAGASTAPEWSTVVLPNSVLVGRVLHASASNTITGLDQSTAGFILTSNGVGAVSSFQAPATQTSALLSATHTDTTASTVTRGDLIVGTGVTPTWDDLAISVTSGTFLRSDGTDVGWSTLSLPNAATVGDILASPVTNQIGNIAAVAAGRYMRSAGVATVPVWSTLILPNSATTGDLLAAGATNDIGNIVAVAAGSFLRSAGTSTVPAWSTLTIPNTVTDNLILYATGTNVIGTNSGFSFDETTLTIPGQIAFPAAQSSSAGANTLDDYEESTWVPTLTFATPGDLSVVYSLRIGNYQKIGRWVHCIAELATSTWTHTTASGNFQVTGLPFAARTETSGVHVGSLNTSGVNFSAGYTFCCPYLQSAATLLLIVESGDNVGQQALGVAAFPTSSNFGLSISIRYEAAA